MPRVLDFSDGFTSSSEPTVVGAAVVNVDRHTVTSGEASAKSFTIGFTPSDSSKTLVFVEGVPQTLSTDFNISGSTFAWTALGLDGVLESGMTVLIYEVS